MTYRVATAMIVLLLSAMPGLAGETIRVAVIQQAESIAVSAPRGVVMRSADADDLGTRDARPVTVTAGFPGFLVGGKSVRADRIEALGRDGETVVNGLAVGGRVTIRNVNGRLTVINELDLEEYVKGVVPAEMNASWHPEALKAQAIAARTYALYQIRQNGKKEFDVVATIKDQVYRGRFGADGPAGLAVERTRDQVLVYRDQPIFAAFHSTAAGLTEDALNVWSLDFPYLKGVECPFDMNSPHYQWRTDVALPFLERRLRDEGFPVGVIAGLAPAAYSRAGRVTQVRILHSDGELYLKGEDLRRVLGYTVLASTQFEFEVVGLRIQFTGRGAGHGVGLCQYGTKELAERGYAAETILRYFYPGAEIRDIPDLPRR
jgi:stage II sporulation protein D